MEKKLKIVLAEDHTILREGLRALLSADPNIEIVGEAQDGRDAVRCVEKLVPDLLLMDLSMPRMSGMDAIREIKMAATAIPVQIHLGWAKAEKSLTGAAASDALFISVFFSMVPMASSSAPRNSAMDFNRFSWSSTVAP